MVYVRNAYSILCKSLFLSKYLRKYLLKFVHFSFPSSKKVNNFLNKLIPKMFNLDMDKE